jgi:hypothetical protein
MMPAEKVSAQLQMTKFPLNSPGAEPEAAFPPCLPQAAASRTTASKHEHNPILFNILYFLLSIKFGNFQNPTGAEVPAGPCRLLTAENKPLAQMKTTFTCTHTRRPR